MRVSPDVLKFIGQMNGELDDEAALHERFKQFRLHGEWFKPEVLPHVQEILRKDAADPRPPRLNVIVSGDSDFRDEALVRQKLDQLHAKDPKRPISWVILGGCTRPVEGAAYFWAQQHKVRVYGYELDWGKYGRGPYAKVNRQLVKAIFDTKAPARLLRPTRSARRPPSLIRRATKAKLGDRDDTRVKDRCGFPLPS